jgi:predicted kinase
MRKWMSERFKRGKKAAEKPTTEGTPASAPLQPKYFEAETTVPAEAPAREAEPSAAAGEASKEPSEAPEPSSESARSQPLPRTTASNDPARRGRRRRRGRGGRSRDSAQPALAVPGAPERAAPVPAVVSPSSPKGTVVLAIGLPGSGKSAWFKRHNIAPLSSDMLRALLFDDPTEQRFQDLIFSNLRAMLKARLIARRPVNYVDATNLTPHERHSWIKLAHDYGYEVQAVFFDVPAEVCLERNQRRERVVPEDVMHRMAAKLRPPAFEEGFTKITVVKVKKKDNEAAES